MMPTLASKSKQQAVKSDSSQLKVSAQVEEVQSTPAEDFGTPNDETKNGILRLADYIHRQKKSKSGIQSQEKKTMAFVKEVSMKEFIFSPAPEETLKRGLDTYAWVHDHKSLAIGTCINKFF